MVWLVHTLKHCISPLLLHTNLHHLSEELGYSGSSEHFSIERISQQAYLFYMKSLFVISFILMLAIPSCAVDSLTVFTLFSKNNIDFTSSGTDQKVSSFLIVNSPATTFTLIIGFSNSCNVTHFRRSNLTIPLTTVRVKVDNVAVHDFTAGECSSFYSWSPPGPLFNDKYQVDISISWTGEPMNIAGTFSETLNYWAYK